MILPTDELSLTEDLFNLGLNFIGQSEISWVIHKFRQIMEDWVNESGDVYQQNLKIIIQSLQSKKNIPIDLSYDLDPDSFFNSWMSHVDAFFDKRKKTRQTPLGQIFTPIAIVDQIILTSFQEFTKDNRNLELNGKNTQKTQTIYYHEWLQNGKIPKILDFAVGSGHFILRIFWGLLREWENILSDNESNSLNQVIKIFDYCRSSLISIDVDFLSCWATAISNFIFTAYYLDRWIKSGIIIKSNEVEEKLIKSLPAKIYHQDFLINGTDIGKFRDQIAIIIGNPPYVFSRDLPQNLKNKLKSKNFNTVKGQYDLIDVFIEQALDLLRPGGVLGVIIPETILTLENHAPIRLYLAQMGDLIRIQKIQQTFIDQTVANILLYVQKGNTTQITFIVGSNQQIVVDRSEGLKLVSNNLIPGDITSEQILSFIRSNFLSINQWNTLHPKAEIECFRGVEISKNGRIMQCPQCQMWMPFSKIRELCPHCHNNFDLDNSPLNFTNLILSFNELNHNKSNSSSNTMKFMKTMYPESTFIESSTYIRIDYPGINYKSPAHYLKQRIIVRQILNKHRICAAIAPQQTMTSQSIYNILLPIQWEPILEILLGYIQSDLVSFYNYYSFSKGKRLFPRILLGKLKDLPWIPKQFHELFPNLPQITSQIMSIPPEFQSIIKTTLEE